MKITDGKKLLKGLGWTMVGVGLYLVAANTTYDNSTQSRKPDDGIIDADFTIIED